MMKTKGNFKETCDVLIQIQPEYLSRGHEESYITAGIPSEI
jgi:hypothetical protein